MARGIKFDPNSNNWANIFKIIGLVLHRDIYSEKIWKGRSFKSAEISKEKLFLFWMHKINYQSSK